MTMQTLSVFLVKIKKKWYQIKVAGREREGEKERERHRRTYKQTGFHIKTNDMTLIFY